MENKNNNAPFNYLPVALLLSVAVVAGVVFSSIRNSGNANLLAVDTSGYTCESVKDHMKAETATPEENAWYEQNCGEQTAPPPAPMPEPSPTPPGAPKDTTPPPTPNTPPTPAPAGTAPGTETGYNCEQSATDIATGNYSIEEKNWYEEHCTQKGTPGTTSGQYDCAKLNSYKDSRGLTPEEQNYYDKNCQGVTDTISEGGCKTGSTDANCDEKAPNRPTQDPCGYLHDLMAKYAQDPTSEQYVSAKKKFDLYCSQTQTSENVCSELKIKLEGYIQNGQTDTDEYLRTKLKFTALCTEATPANDRCAELKAKLETYIQNGDSTSEGYASVKAEFLKSCQKPLRPANFEDDVQNDFDQKDCPFSDSKVSELCGKAAMELYRRGVIGGFADGTFRGNEPVNRAQAAKFLLLARFSVVNDDSGSADFHDVEHGAWYERFVLRASHIGVISGYGDGTFRPANGVNTAEFLKMMSLAFDLDTGLSYTYSDVHDSDWFAKYAGSAEKYNLFPDRAKGKLDPGRKLTRCEVAIAIYEYLSHR